MSTIKVKSFKIDGLYVKQVRHKKPYKKEGLRDYYIEYGSLKSDSKFSVWSVIDSVFYVIGCEVKYHKNSKLAISYMKDKIRNARV